ncbi:MAG: hypothetical protein CMA37_01850 [Euryarchaeota archaeon]|nr:hypothetical protein [Euryarchaeota archaeon]
MVEITCPHCSEDLELPDDAFGDFECPICEEEFVWGQQPVEVIYNLPKEKGITKLTLNIVALWNGFILLVAIGFIVVLILGFLLE